MTKERCCEEKCETSLWISSPWLFSRCCKGSSTTVLFCWRNYLGYESLSVLLLGESLWMLPWALSRTRHRVSWSKQLWRNSNTLLFSPWPVLQNIVCTSVILPTLWAHRDTPLLSHHHVFAASHSLSALMSIHFLSFSLSCSHHRVIPFFLLHKDIVKQIHLRAFSHWHPYTNTPRALKIHPCVKITLS